MPEPSRKGKKGKKGAAAAAPADDDDIDALLAEIGDGAAFWVCNLGLLPCAGLLPGRACLAACLAGNAVQSSASRMQLAGMGTRLIQGRQSVKPCVCTGRPASADATLAPDAAAESGPAPATDQEAAANAEDDEAAEDGKV